jgi:type VI protein secretion system component Hcp
MRSAVLLDKTVVGLSRNIKMGFTMEGEEHTLRRFNKPGAEKKYLELRWTEVTISRNITVCNGQVIQHAREISTYTDR